MSSERSKELDAEIERQEWLSRRKQGMLDSKRFHVRAFRTSASSIRPIEVMAVRCTVCGINSEPFGRDGYAVLLSDLESWAVQHRCPPLAVTVTNSAGPGITG